jgi:hypothetical protein
LEPCLDGEIALYSAGDGAIVEYVGLGADSCSLYVAPAGTCVSEVAECVGGNGMVATARGEPRVAVNGGAKGATTEECYELTTAERCYKVTVAVNDGVTCDEEATEECYEVTTMEGCYEPTVAANDEVACDEEVAEECYELTVAEGCYKLMVTADDEVACDEESAEECYDMTAMEECYEAMTVEECYEVMVNGDVTCDEEEVGGGDLAKGSTGLRDHDDAGGGRCGCVGLHGDRGGGGGARGPTSYCCMTVAQSVAPRARGG